MPTAKSLPDCPESLVLSGVGLSGASQLLLLTCGRSAWGPPDAGRRDGWERQSLVLYRCSLLFGGNLRFLCCFFPDFSPMFLWSTYWDQNLMSSCSLELSLPQNLSRRGAHLDFKHRRLLKRNQGPCITVASGPTQCC